MGIDKPEIPSAKKRIYFHIADHGTVSKANLLSAFGMTSSTLTRLLEEMIAEGLIRESGFGVSSGGRRPILYQTNPDYGYIFGLEISRYYSTLGLFDMQMNLKSHTRMRMDETMHPERFVKLTSDHMRSFLRDHKIGPERVIGMGIGAVGPLNRNTGTILNPLYFPAQGWCDIPICRMLEEETGITGHLENGANAALVGEQWALRPDNIQHAIYVHAGVGLRSAMMSYGQIVHGMVDMEGSIGQMIIQTDGPRLSASGNYGALEAFSSVQALEKQARSQAKMGNVDLLGLSRANPDQLNYEMLVQAVTQDNPTVLELFKQSAVYFGIGLANLINVFHPEMVILGGTLMNSNPIFYSTAIDIAIKNTYYYPHYEPRFSKGQLKEDAVVTGAAILAWRRVGVG